MRPEIIIRVFVPVDLFEVPRVKLDVNVAASDFLDFACMFPATIACTTFSPLSLPAKFFVPRIPPTIVLMSLLR